VSNGAAASRSEERARAGEVQEVHSGANESASRAHLAPAGIAPQPVAERRSVVPRVFGVAGVSVGAHMALLGVLGFMPAQVIEERKEVTMEIAEPEPPPPPPPPAAAEEPKPEPEPAPKPKAAPPKPAAAPKAAPEPPQSDPKPAAEAPVDLTGVTLTGDDGASWSSVVGNGEAIQGPAARIAKVTGRDRAGSSDGVVGGQGKGPALVGEDSLSRKPVAPPGLDALLEQYFPPRARAQGVSGSARVRVRILADGSVGPMTVLRETGGGFDFGSSCMKALKQKRWQPPLDKRGQPVATEINFDCEFDVSY
jgi:TonB family protein